MSSPGLPRGQQAGFLFFFVVKPGPDALQLLVADVQAGIHRYLPSCLEPSARGLDTW
jgi:hypothetical protein